METVTLEQKLTELRGFCKEHSTCSTCPLQNDAGCSAFFYDVDKIKAKYEQYKIVKVGEVKKEITDLWNKLYPLLIQHFCKGRDCLDCDCLDCDFYSKSGICHLSYVVAGIGKTNVSN